MKTIRISRGLECIVDDEDFCALSAYRWFACPARNENFYAARMQQQNGTRQTIKMHRQIMGHPDGLVDHVNRNTLDNRRSNLRNASYLQNNTNTRIPKNNTTGYKGVSKAKHGNKHRYGAHIRVNGILKHIGWYANPRDAGQAYNEAAVKYFGEFASLNAIPAPIT